MVIDDFRSAAPQVPALSADAGRKVGDIKGELLSVKQAADHEYVPGLERHPVLALHRELYAWTVEVKRNRFTVQEFELVRAIEKTHIDTPDIRAVIMHYLIIGGCNLRLADKVLQHKPVLYLTDPQDRMESAVGLRHRLYDSGHVMQLFLIFCFSPLVSAVRKKFLVVLCRVIISVKKVLKVVEPDDITLDLGLLGSRSQ